MRLVRLRGLGGAFCFVAALAVTTALPAPVADRAPAPPSAAAVARNDALSRVEEQIAVRLPELDELERTRLADAVVDEAAGARVDPLFVMALIEVESSFDPQATSGRGARGLMQLRPATLAYTAARERLGDVEINDPVDNVVAGVRYYRRLLHAFGKVDLALMAYNAGPHRIHEYLHHGRGRVPERFKGYPRRVRREYARLLQAYGEAPATAVAEVTTPLAVAHE